MPRDPENEQFPTQGYTRLIDMQLDRTLGQQLVHVVDGIRDIATQLGVRPYEVHRVRTQWSGGRRGIGAETVVDDQPILPTPLVVDLTGVQAIVQPIGLDEVGGIKVVEISGRFEEDWFFSRDKLGNPPPPDLTVYFEVQFPRLDDRPGQRRRFVLAAAPYWNAENVAWEIELKKSHEDRARTGTVR